MTAADDVCGGDYFYDVFFHKVSWVGSGIELCQFLRIFYFNPFYTVLRARRNEKELKVKPATSFKYFQYLLTKN